MARDYSSRRNNPPSNGKRKPVKRPRPAAKPAHRKPPPRARGRSAGAAGCIWMLCGLFLAVAAGAGYYIVSRPRAHGPESVSVQLPSTMQSAGGSGADHTATSGQSNGQSNNQNGVQSAKQNGKPRFSFYQLLPKYKVEVPSASQGGTHAQASHNAPHETDPGITRSAPGPTHNAAPTHQAQAQIRPAHQATATPGAHNAGGATGSGGGYVIQAGAFSTHQDADHRKAQLALLGVTANIIDTQTTSGQTVYRVQSETIGSANQAHTLAQRLQSHGIATMVRQTD